MRKTGQDRVKKEGKKSLVFVLVLCVMFFLSTGGSYYYFKDKFSLESPFEEDTESVRIKDIRRDQDSEIDRLYKSKERTLPVRGGTVFRKDTLLVVAEDFIRTHLSSYRVRLLDLYLDKEGVLYVDFGSELVKNFSGDVNDEIALIGELFTGVKRVIPGFNALKILIGGREAESFGGHIDISKPIGEEIARSMQ